MTDEEFRTIQAHALKEISESLQAMEKSHQNHRQVLAILVERSRAHDRKLSQIGRAVLGNGREDRSLIARVAAIEAGNRTFWKIIAAIGVIGGAVAGIVAACS